MDSSWSWLEALKFPHPLLGRFVVIDELLGHISWRRWGLTVDEVDRKPFGVDDRGYMSTSWTVFDLLDAVADAFHVRKLDEPMWMRESV